MKNFSKLVSLFLCILLVVTSVTYVSAAPTVKDVKRYEAEIVIPTGTYELKNDVSGYSGAGYCLFKSVDASIEFTVDVAANGYYTISAGYVSPTYDRYSRLTVNGINKGDPLLKATAANTVGKHNFGTFYLSAGSNKIKITANWVDYGIDYIEVGTFVKASDPTVKSKESYYEAEDNPTYGEITYETAFTGFTGTSYLYFRKDTDTVEFTVKASKAGYYPLKMRVISPESAKTSRVYVNGTKALEPVVPYTTAFTDLSCGNVYLNSGENKIKIEGYSVLYGLDYIVVGDVDSTLNPKSFPSDTTVYQAESGTMYGCYVATAQSRYSGTGYVTGLNTAASYLIIPVNVSEAGKYEILARYLSIDATRENRIYINDVDKGTVSFPKVSEFTDKSLGKYDLNKGINYIKIVPVSGYVDYDCFFVKDNPSATIDPDLDYDIDSIREYIYELSGSKKLTGYLYAQIIINLKNAEKFFGRKDYDKAAKYLDKIIKALEKKTMDKYLDSNQKSVLKEMVKNLKNEWKDEYTKEKSKNNGNNNGRKWNDDDD